MFRNHIINFWPDTVAEEWFSHSEFKRIYDVVKDTALPNFLQAKQPITSGLNICNWKLLLVDYPDQDLLDFLEFGWPVDYVASYPPTPTLINHEKSPLYLEHVKLYIEKEVSLGALLGPFDNPPFYPWFQVSPIMTRPKKDSDARRVILDLSFPKQKGVNAGIERKAYLGEPYTFKLPSIDTLTSELERRGKGCFLWSGDLARAYRQLRVCPLSTPLLGISFEGKFYVDVAPPFGCRNSALACERTTRAVVWLLRRKGFFVQCYLDDFVGLESSEERALEAFQEFQRITTALGLALAPEKCIPPTTKLTWLGFEVDTVSMVVKLPQGKMDEVLLEVGTWAPTKPVSRSELRSLVGKLKHLAKCVIPASRFFARILEALRAAPYFGKKLLPAPFFQDVSWFLTFAQHSNGIVLIPVPLKTPWLLECDSSLTGAGAFSPTHYYMEEYSEGYLTQVSNIVHLEALNVIQALKALLPPSPQNFSIVVSTDNLATQQVLSSGTGRDRYLTACARELWLLAALHSLDITVLHKPGKDLVLADALSRSCSSSKAEALASSLVKSKCLSRVRVEHSVKLLTETL